MSVKVVVPLFLIVSSISWLAVANLNTANYFYLVNELEDVGDQLYQKNLKVKGRVVPGTIKDKQKPVAFTIAEEGAELNVLYVGTEPLPDLFQDRAEAVVEGRMREDGVFEAVHLQAKCASKYEAGAPEVADTNYGRDEYNQKSGYADQQQGDATQVAQTKPE